jgi:hypothetical protein
MLFSHTPHLNRNQFKHQLYRIAKFITLVGYNESHYKTLIHFSTVAISSSSNTPKHFTGSIEFFLFCPIYRRICTSTTIEQLTFLPAQYWLISGRFFWSLRFWNILTAVGFICILIRLFGWFTHDEQYCEHYKGILLYIFSEH